jgi:hypothetical protein
MPTQGRNESTSRRTVLPVRTAVWLAPVRNLVWVAAHFGHR